MAREDQVAKLKESVGQVLAYEPKAMITRSDQWGTISFSNAEADLNRVFAVLNHLKVLPTEHLTDKAIGEINSHVVAVLPFLKKIDEFSVEQNNATGSRDEIVQHLHNAAESLYASATQWIPFLAYQAGDVSSNIKALTASVTEGKALVDQAKLDLSEKRKEIDDIVTKAREASASAGAAVFTTDFADEAEGLQGAAVKWLIATAVLGIITLVIAIGTWFWTQDGLDQGQIWQKVASKVVTLSVTLTATLWCGRIYKALMHQSTTNKHRALSLQTFQAFSSAASDDQTKNAVLLETTRSIFGISPTGFVNSDGQTSESPSRWIEIAKNVAPEE